MQLGIFAKTFAGAQPMTVLTAAARTGYSCVQYNMACSGPAAMPDAITTAEAGAVARAARDCDVGIAAVSGTYNMIHPDPRQREMGLARLEVLASHCRALGTRMITLCTGSRDAADQWRAHPDNATPEAWRDLLASMTQAVAIAERWNIDLGIEPELGNVVSSARKAHLLLQEMASPHLKIVLDPANLFERASLDEQRHLISSAVDLLGDRIAMGHAKDRAADGSFIAAGQGVVDFRHYIGKLKAIGFDGPLVTHGLAAKDATAVAAFLARIVNETP